MAAFNSGDVERLNEPFEEDEASANFIIAQIRSGAFWNLEKRPVAPGEEAPRLDVRTGLIEWEEEPEYDEQGQPVQGTGKPIMETEVSGWMPRSFDGVPTLKRRIESWMKSDEWRNLDRSAQEATYLYYDALLRLEMAKAKRDAVVKNETAQELGLTNAAKPQQPSQMPSLPSPSGAAEEPAAA
jgi:hypothetical protein